MGRPSNRKQRRREIADAFETVLAEHGLGGATVAAVAEEAGCAPGLIHHHFEDREDLMTEVLKALIGRFRAQVPTGEAPDAFLDAYVDAALSLRPQAGRTAARAWVGVLAEAIRSERVARLLRSILRTELQRLERQFQRSGLTPRDAEQRAAGLVASILGCLVFGAVMPGKATGFAAPFVREAFQLRGRGDQTRRR